MMSNSHKSVTTSPGLPYVQLIIDKLSGATVHHIRTLVWLGFGCMCVVSFGGGTVWVGDRGEGLKSIFMESVPITFLCPDLGSHKDSFSG